MNQLPRVIRLVFLICVAFGVSSSTQAAPKKSAPPNWKVSAVGTSTLAAIDTDTRTDIDAFGGNSSHLGKFTGAGYHVLDLHTFQFAGIATYSAANGDTLSIAYEGQLFLSGDATFPYGIVANVEIQGGTGRFANATGGGEMTGGFTGEVPVGGFFFDIEGTLSKK
jgi:hypothetical protein